MTVSSGDKVASVPTKTGRVTVGVETVSVGDKVVSIPTKNGPVLASVSTVSVGDKCLFVPDKRGKYIAIKSGVKPYRLMVTDISASGKTWLSDDGITWTAGSDLGFTAAAFAWDDVNKIAYACETKDSGYSAYTRIWKSVDYGVTWSSWTNAPGQIVYDNNIYVMSDGNLLVFTAPYTGGYVPKVAIIDRATGTATIKYTGALQTDTRQDFYAGMVVTDTNRIVACFSFLSAAYIRIITSDDWGNTWSTHDMTPTGDPFVDGVSFFRPTAMCYAGNGRIILSLYVSVGPFYVVGGACSSSDSGNTWSAWDSLTLPGNTGIGYDCDIFSPVPGIVLGWFITGGYYYSELYQSTNSGSSWTKVTVSQPGWSSYYQTCGKSHGWKRLSGNNVICYLCDRDYSNFYPLPPVAPVMVLHSKNMGRTWTDISTTYPTGGYCILKMFI